MTMLTKSQLLPALAKLPSHEACNRFVEELDAELATALGGAGTYLNDTLASGSALALTSNVGKAVASLVLTPGEWLIWARVGVIGDPGTTLTQFYGSINTVSGTVQADENFALVCASFTLGAFSLSFPVPMRRLEPLINTTYYLNCRAVFATAGLNGYGSISAKMQ